MNFNKKDLTNKIGEKLGFATMFFIFSTMLYFILKFLNKLPSSWNYFNILLLTLLIVLIGVLIKLWLNK